MADVLPLLYRSLGCFEGTVLEDGALFDLPEAKFLFYIYRGLRIMLFLELEPLVFLRLFYD